MHFNGNKKGLFYSLHEQLPAHILLAELKLTTLWFLRRQKMLWSTTKLHYVCALILCHRASALVPVYSSLFKPPKKSETKWMCVNYLLTLYFQGDITNAACSQSYHGYKGFIYQIHGNALTGLYKYIYSGFSIPRSLSQVS